MHDLRFIPTREILRDWSFITCDVGPPFCRRGGHFQNLDWFWGTFSEVREHYLGVILRWLDTAFQSQYLPSLSINFVAINKVLEKLPPQLY